MALLNNQVIEFVCWITGNSAETVEGQLNIWLSEQRAKPVEDETKDPVIQKMKLLYPEVDKTGLENRYKYLSLKLQNEIDNMTVREVSESMDEIINIEYKLKD